jgi:hypothetical protein
MLFRRGAAPEASDLSSGDALYWTQRLGRRVDALVDAFRPNRGVSQEANVPKGMKHRICVYQQAPASCAKCRIWHKEGRESWLEPSPWIGKGNVLGADGLRYGSLSWVDYFQFRKLGSKR